jgi:Zn-dependent protease
MCYVSLMLPTQQGSIRLFRFAGIDVFLHWSWFILAFYEVSTRSRYGSAVWVSLEFLALFGIVLMHEFGHALACRSTGGKAEQIILWPFGGVAYVAPPARPGAMLWSIAAGPLVNVILTPVLWALLFAARQYEWAASFPNTYRMVQAILVLNIVMLVFNLLPIYPLDGGQMLRSLLWFFIGPIRSLMAASIIGLLGVALLIGSALLARNVWLVLIAGFIALNCWGALMRARAYARLAALPRRQGFACPQCGKNPLMAPVWRCAKCHKNLDPFETNATCPYCGELFPSTACSDCGASSPIHAWAQPPRTGDV